jgi:hypothetical protein
VRGGGCVCGEQKKNRADGGPAQRYHACLSFVLSSLILCCLSSFSAFGTFSVKVPSKPKSETPRFMIDNRLRFVGIVSRDKNYNSLN